MSTRPYPWENSYPPGMRWDAPIETTTLPALIDRSAARFRRAAGDRISRPPDYSTRIWSTAPHALAAGLLRHGIGSGTAVALYLPNTPDHPIAFLAQRAPARASCISARSMPNAS